MYYELLVHKSGRIIEYLRERCDSSYHKNYTKKKDRGKNNDEENNISVAKQD